MLHPHEVHRQPKHIGPFALATVLTASLLAAPTTLLADTLTVDDDLVQFPTADYTNIQAAIDAASNGDEVLVYPGTYTGAGTFVVSPLGKSITIRASGTREETIIDGEGLRRVVMCNAAEGPGTVISGFTITGGNSSSGGGISFSFGASPTISDCTISGNAATYGGGMRCTVGSPTIIGCTISGNTASSGAGVDASDSAGPSLSNCIITDNVATSVGGGIATWSHTGTSITGCTISNNVAAAGGGVFCGYGGAVTISDSVLCGGAPSPIDGLWSNGGGNCIAFSCTDSNGDGSPDECTPVGDGVHEVPSEFATIQSAIMAAGAGDTVIVAPGTYTASGADDWVINPGGKPITIRASGSAAKTILDGQGARPTVYCGSGEGPSTIIQGFTITGGSSIYGGGGIRCEYSSPAILHCTIVGNSASRGGGAYAAFGSPTFAGCTIANNAVTSDGGGLFAFESDMTVTDCDFSGNTARNGGAIGCGDHSRVTLTHCEITTGSATLSGGGVYGGDTSEFTITDCTISQSAATFGGGIFCEQSSAATVANSVISLNSAASGGGIYCAAGSSVDLSHCSITENASTASSIAGGGGLLCSAANPTISYCDFVGNTAAGNGGGIYCVSASNPAITATSFVGNAAGYNGGGMSCIDTASPTIRTCQFSHNSATSFGGAVDWSATGTAVLEDITFSQNTALFGAGIVCGTDGLSLERCAVSNNHASAVGGGILSSAPNGPSVSDGTLCANLPDQVIGTWMDMGGTCVSDDCADCAGTCPADLDSNGQVSGSDLATLLGAWGPCEGLDCSADIDGDGEVKGADLAILLGAWGACP